MKKEEWHPVVRVFNKKGEQIDPSKTVVPKEFTGYYKILEEIGAL